MNCAANRCLQGRIACNRAECGYIDYAGDEPVFTPEGVQRLSFWFWIASAILTAVVLLIIYSGPSLAQLLRWGLS